MRMRVVLAAVLLAAACKKPPVDGGLIATVKIDPAAQVTCIELTLSNTMGTPLTSKRFPRAGKAELEIGIAQAAMPTSLPADIRVRARGLWSVSECTEPARPNTAPADQQAKFTAGKVDRIDFTLRPPGPADDADGDGYTGATSQGPDCDDTQRTINPGATEACAIPVDYNCNGRIGCDDPACAGLACVRPAAALAFINAPLSVVATTCSPALVVEARDDMGTPAPVQAATTVTLTEQGGLGLTFYQDTGCTLPATSADIPRGMTQVRFYARTAVAGTTRIEAQGGGFQSAQQDFRVLAGPAVGIAFRTAAQTVKSDACSQAVTVEARDLSNNAASVAADLPLTLVATPAAGFGLFSDASCSTALASPSLMSGTSSFTFFFKPARPPGMVTLEATAGALGMATQTQTIVPGAPTRIVFVTAMQRVVAGACSTAMTLKLQDAQGTDTIAEMPTGLALAGPTMTFFTTSTCAAGSSITQANVPLNTGSVTVYFTATGAGTPLVTASGPGLTLATQSQTVDPAAPVRLGFTTAAQGVQTTQCSGPVRLSTLDAFGNPSNVTGAALAIGLSANPAAGFSFYAGAGCGGSAITTTSIAAGANTVTYSYRGNTAGTVVMTADSALDPDPTQMTNIGVMPPSTLVYLTTAQSRAANECSGAVTLESHDSGGNRSNVASDVVITLAAAPATGFRFFSDSQCTNAVTSVTLPANASQVTYYWLGTTAGAIATTPTAATLTGPGAQTATVRPGAASKISFLAPARSATAGLCSQSLTVQSKDAWDNVAPVTLDTALALSASPSGGLTFHTDSACATAAVGASTITAAQSQTVFYARGNLVPAYNLTAQHPSVGQTTQALSITAAAAAKLVVLTSPQTVPTGVCSGALTFERRDSFDNPVTVATPLTVTLTGGAGLTFYTAPGCGSGLTTSAQILASASTVTVYFRGTTPGSPSVTGSAASVATPGTQTQTITVSAPTALAFSTGPQTMVVAGTVSMPVTLEARDAFGNPSPVTMNTPITLGALPAMFDYCGDAACVGLNPSVQLNAGLSSTTFFFRGNIAQAFSISATSAIGSTSQNQAVVPAAASQLTFTTGAQSRSAGGCSLIATVQRQDPFGNPVTAGGALTVNLSASPAAGFSFYATSNCTGLTQTQVFIAAGQHSASFYFNGTVPASVQITAAAAGLTSAQQTETIAAIPPDRLVFITGPQTMTASTTSCTGPFTLETRDQFNNAAAVAGNTLVSLSATGAATATFFSDSGCTTTATSVTVPALGTSTSFWLRATGAGTTHQLTASNAGLGSVQQGFTVDPAAATQLQFTTAPLSMRVQTCSSVATVRTADPFGNTSGVAALTTLTPVEVPSGGVTFFSDASCSTPLAGITLNPGQSTGSFYMRGGNTIQMVSVTVSAGSTLTSVQQTETVTVGLPNKLVFTTAQKSLMAGECSGPMTVQSQDVANNPSSLASATAVNLSAAAPTGVTFFTDGACTAAGTATSIAAGANTATFSMRGITSGAPLVTAAAVAGITNPNATQTVNVAPAVRSGSCAIANGTTSIGCTISPPLNADLSKTFFVFQSTSVTTSIDDTAVRCSLTNETTLTCTRSGTMGAVNLQWYTVSRPSGLNVQHFPAVISNAASGVTTTQAITAVNPAQTFVLMSTSLPTPTPNGSRWSSVRLASATSVEIQRLAAPDTTLTHALQVVSWSGATVERGAVTLTNGNMTVSATTLPDSGTDPAFVLYSWRYNNVTADREICRLALRGEVANATTLTFTRAVGSAGQCDDHDMVIEYERVRLPGQRVDSNLVSMPNATLEAAPVTIAAVDLTRTLPFTGANSFAGQGMGESSDTQDDRFRDSIARATLTNATTLQLTRAEPGATGTTASLWSVFVWQVVP